MYIALLRTEGFDSSRDFFFAPSVEELKEKCERRVMASLDVYESTIESLDHEIIFRYVETDSIGVGQSSAPILVVVPVFGKFVALRREQDLRTVIRELFSSGKYDIRIEVFFDRCCAHITSSCFSGTLIFYMFHRFKLEELCS